MATPLEQASNPQTPAADLQALAAQGGEVQLAVVQNPAAYPQLLEWIKEWGEPAARDVAAERLADETVLSGRQEKAAAAATSDETVLASTPSAATQAPSQGRKTAPTTPEPAGASLPPAMPPPAGPSRAAQDAPGPGIPAPGTPQFPAPPPPSATAAKKSKLPLIIAAAVVAVLAIAGGAWFLFTGSDEEATAGDGVVVIEDGPSEDPEAGASGEDTTGEAVEEETAPLDTDNADLAAEADLEETAIEEGDGLEDADSADQEQFNFETVHYPGVDGAIGNDIVTAPWFVSHLKNIACEMGGAETRCTIYDYRFPLNEGGCGSKHATMVLKPGEVGWDCSGAPVKQSASDDPPLLEKNTTSVSGGVVCTATPTDMTCWNAYTGTAFALGEAGWMIGDDGPIPPQDFDW